MIAIYEGLPNSYIKEIIRHCDGIIDIKEKYIYIPVEYQDTFIVICKMLGYYKEK